MGDAGRGGVVVSDEGSKRRELALTLLFPGVQSAVTSPKSIPHPGSVLQLCLLHTSVALHRDVKIGNTTQTTTGMCWWDAGRVFATDGAIPPCSGRKTGIFSGLICSNWASWCPELFPAGTYCQWDQCGCWMESQGQRSC